MTYKSAFFTNRRVLRASAAAGQGESTRPTLITAINVVASVSRESGDKLQTLDRASRAAGGGHSGEGMTEIRCSRVLGRATGVKVVKLSLGHGQSEALL